MKKITFMFITLVTVFSQSYAATSNWLQNITIRRVVNTINGDYIYIDQQTTTELKDGGSCALTLLDGSKVGVIYINNSTENPRSHYLSGILTAFSTGVKIKQALVIGSVSPVFNVTGLGSTSCYFDYIDYAN